MNRRYLPILFLAMVLTARGEVMNKPKLDLYPDTVVLNDGTTLRGLIVRNDAQILTLQQRVGEKEIPKSYIRRIIDDNHESAYFAEIMEPGKLPPWRMIVQDLRSDDNIRSFRQIPATTIDKGYLRNIPYLSFRINRRVEMNIYGNPEDPVCLEFGVYERNPEEITKFRKITRAYLAGILRSRQEVAALYSLPETGGEKRVGKITFKVLPPSAPDAFGGWWISIYQQNRLASFRVPDDVYRKNTLPFDEVNNRDGKLRDDKGAFFDKFLQSNMTAWSSMIPDLRGFYRDKMGGLKLLFTKKPAATTP